MALLLALGCRLCLLPSALALALELAPGLALALWLGLVLELELGSCRRCCPP